MALFSTSVIVGSVGLESL